MIKLSKIFFLVIVLLFGFITLAIAETATLHYMLCKNNVAQMNLISHAEKSSLIIKLSKSATEDFKNITAKNIGRRLIIMINDSIVTNAIIKVEINSGTIESVQMTELDAKIMQQKILNSSGGPCGLVK